MIWYDSDRDNYDHVQVGGFDLRSMGFIVNLLFNDEVYIPLHSVESVFLERLTGRFFVRVRQGQLTFDGEDIKYHSEILTALERRQ